MWPARAGTVLPSIFWLLVLPLPLLPWFMVVFFARFSRWWGGAVWRVERVSRARSLTVLVVAQKKAADYTYPMGIERWYPTSWSSSGVALGTRNATDGMSSSRTQMRI